MEKYSRVIDIADSETFTVILPLALLPAYPRIITMQATGIADDTDPIPTATVDIFGSINGGSSWFPVDSVSVSPTAAVDSGVIDTPIEQLKYVLDETTTSTTGTIDIDILVDYGV
jgi:hypothetical protein